MFLIWRQVWFTNNMISLLFVKPKDLCASLMMHFLDLFPHGHQWMTITMDDNYNWITTMLDPWLSTLSCPFKNSKMPTKPFLNEGWKLEAWFIHECGLNCDGNEDKCKYNSKRLTRTWISPQYEKPKVLKCKLKAYTSPTRGP